MSILGILVFIALLQNGAALDVIAPSRQRALVSNDTSFNCSFSVNEQPLDLNFLAVLWIFQGQIILRYDKKGFSTQDPRMSLNVESLTKGDASLHISNVTISDGGIYRCKVIYSPESKEKEIVFEVLARPQLAILSTKVQSNKENTLTCKATGFFPPDVLITWHRDGGVLKNFMGDTMMYKDGTYQANSTVTITPTDRDQIISCRVRHDSLQEPLQRDFRLNYEDTEASPNVVTVVIVVVIVLVIAILIVGIVVFLRKRKLRKKDMKALTIMDIEGPAKLVAGEETSLHCRATNCPENVSVTWLERKGGKEREIPAFMGKDKEEEERLLDTLYDVISCREGPHYISVLKFRPSVAEHKDVTLICRYSCGKQKKEKTFDCRTIYGKPQLLHPVSQSLFVSGELKYLITLEKFYPRDITLRWTRGVDESQETINSTEIFTDLLDGTYSVCSEVRIPEELLKDPKFRVRATWEHQSLDTPEYKDLSIRDSEYPWNPVMEEIQTPHLFHDTPITLQCPIYEYFPDAITVTWLRRRDNELCEETENVISMITTPSRKEADNTYSCTSGLTICPKLSVHQGAEYICRVAHPSLERPIERTTEKLVVRAKPQMVEPIMITVGESSRVHFTLHLQKFYPKDIDIKWQYESGNKTYEMSNENTITEYEDLTYDIKCVGKIPINVFKDLNFKVSVTWKHESMEEPENRTPTIRDLPWRPKVGEIIIPKLEEEKQTSLTCDISGYFPDQLTVSWFKKEPENDLDLIITPLQSQYYKVSNKKHKLNDKTFHCQTSLTITPTFSRDQGAEFICRVEHPTLEQPIEKTTGPITIDLPCPQVGEIIIPNLKVDEKASLTCHISGCFPKYLNMSWFRKEPGADHIMTPLPNEDFQTVKEQNYDKTSCRTSLTFTPSFSRDEGAEFICRVNYERLEPPIERTTGPIHFNELSVNGNSQTKPKTSFTWFKMS